MAVTVPKYGTAPTAAPATIPIAAIGRVGRIIGRCIIAAVVTWVTRAVAVIAAIVRRGDCSAD
jgi:hypothetical protein